jgi:hypothetical protein
VAVAKALGASPVILTGTRNSRLSIGRELGADRVVNINDEDAVEVVKQLTGGIGADYVVECAGTEATINQAIHLTNRGENLSRRISARSGHDGHRASREEQYLRLWNSWRRPQRNPAGHGADGGEALRRHENPYPHISAGRLPTALRYARERIEDAIKVVVTHRQANAIANAAAE